MIRYYGPRKRRIGGQILRNWYVQSYDPATRRRTWLSTGTPSHRAALAWIEQRRYEAAIAAKPGFTQLRELNPETGPTLKEATDRWLSDQAITSGPKTIKELERQARQWVAALGDVALVEITEDQLRRFLLARREVIQGSTTNQERKVLKWFFHWAEKKRLILQSPVAGIPAFKEDPHRPRILDEEELSLLLQKARPDVRPLFEIAVETGLRRGALLSLLWEDLDLEKGWLRLPGDRQKSGRTFEVPLSLRAMEVLQDLRVAVSGRVFKLQRSQLGRLFRRAAHAAGLHGLKFHDLRKPFLTRLRRKGVPLEVAMELSDHRSIEVVLKVYRAVERRDLLDAVGRGKTPLHGAENS